MSPASDVMEETAPLLSTVSNGSRNEEWVASSMGQWTRELSRSRLLSREQEVELAKRIEAGDQEARDIFVESNLKLVVSIARRYMGSGVPMEDLIQEGNIGLIKAVDKFDYRKGCRFSTCAVLWIEQYIRRSIRAHKRSITIPLRVEAELNRIRRVIDLLAQETGHLPSPQEVAQRANLGVDRVLELVDVPEDPVSLDVPVDDEEHTRLAEMLVDTEGESPLDALLTDEDRMDVARAVAALSERDQYVVRHRYGLGGESPRTLEEIGETLGVSRQRVRQIERAALDKIRLGAALELGR